MNGVHFDGSQAAPKARKRPTGLMKPQKSKRRCKRRLTEHDARMIRVMEMEAKWKRGMATDDIGLIYRCSGQNVRAEVKRFRAEAEAARQQAELDAGGLPG